MGAAGILEEGGGGDAMSKGAPGSSMLVARSLRRQAAGAVRGLTFFARQLLQACCTMGLAVTGSIVCCMNAEFSFLLSNLQVPNIFSGNVSQESQLAKRTASTSAPIPIWQATLSTYIVMTGFRIHPNRGILTGCSSLRWTLDVKTLTGSGLSGERTLPRPPQP